VNLYRVFPATSETVPFDDPATQLAFLPELTPPRLPWIRAVMVTNSAGSLVDAKGTSSGLSKGADRALLRLYRQSADVVLVGSTTVKAEPIPLPENTPLGVVTSSGDLSGHQLLVKPGQEFWVITSESGVEKAQATLPGLSPRILTVGSSGEFSPNGIIEALSSHTPAAHILVEGGKSLYETFAPVTDEVCISVAPPPLSDHNGIPQWWPTSRDNWELVSLLTDDERMLYFRYRTHRNGVPSNPLEGRPIP